jgi:MYXO-CTERM domain-containing protein
MDDRTPKDQMGYELELVDGSPPAGLVIPEGVSLVGLRRLDWGDGASDHQDEFSFRLRVRAVDLAGNRGPWSEPATIEDPGSGGCSAGAGPASLAALAVLAVRRRRPAPRDP